MRSLFQRTLFVLFLPLFGIASDYYIDSSAGFDGNDGISTTTAWQSLARINSHTFAPGDRILFKRGGFWSGQLWPKGSGNELSAILIDAYGKGPLPILAGKGEVENVVYLYNQPFWEIKNLEITNYKLNDNNIKRGIYILAEDYGTLNHIQIKNCYIHDVNGSMKTKHNGGIFLEIKGDSKRSKFNDVVIENCRIVNVDRTGISNTSSWSERTLTDDGNWYPSTNIVIKNNWLERIGANGLIVRVAKNPIIEHNVFKQCSLKGSGNASFPFNTDDAVFQFNEAYETVFNPGDQDAGGFDSDYRSKRSIFQYNYSHDNDFGFMLIVCNGAGTGFNDGTIVRYNISQNDNSYIFRVSGPASNSLVYNNTIYVSEDMAQARKDSPYNGKPYVVIHKSWNGYSDDTRYYNNIFINNSPDAVYEFGKSTGNIFDYNVFYGFHPQSEPDDSHKKTVDPQLVDPGSGGLGFETLSGYRLQKDSPCINSGKFISNNGGRDFFGNPVPSDRFVDRGAHEFVTSTKVNGKTEDLSAPRLFQNSPNPFNNMTKIYYNLSTPANVHVNIYDLSSRIVRSLYSGFQQAGIHDLKWDGKNDLGRIISSGIYFCRLSTERGKDILKMTVLH